MAQVLRPLHQLFTQQSSSSMLVGLEAPDDAAVYAINSHQAIISTVDFFPPVVDDPYHFGAIAAANALSDVYAMGGEPLMAINLVAFPENLDIAILSEILRGGGEKVLEAGAIIAGGHTITDKEPKYGLAVTGKVHPDKIFRKGGAQHGDTLILTKPLGAGVITTANKRQNIPALHLQSVINGMSRLNKNAASVLKALPAGSVHAVTDITGYSLMGHGHEMAHLSHADLVIKFDSLPWYPEALSYAEAENFAGGLFRNKEYFQQWVTIEKSLDDWQENLLYDPQTSGGLLIALQPNYAEIFLYELKQLGESAYIIGGIQNGEGKIIIQ